MTFYFILLIFFFSQVLLLSFLKRYKSSYLHLNKFFLILNLILIIIFATIRSFSVGGDLATYIYFYRLVGIIKNYSLSFVSKIIGMEYGFSLLVIICNNLFNERILLLIVSLLTYIPIFHFIKKYSSNYCLSILIFLCFELYNQSFNIMRQFIAIGILLLSFQYIKKQSFLRFFMIVLLASLFHKTALIFLFFYPLYRIKKIPNYFYFIYFIFFSAFFIFGKEITDILTYILYSKYMGERSGNYGLSILINITIIISFILVQKYNGDYQSDQTFFIIMALMCLLFNVLGLQSDLFTRIMFYFKIFYIVSIPNMIDSIKNNLVKNSAFYFISCLFVIYYIHALYSSTLYGTLPYLIM